MENLHPETIELPKTAYEYYGKQTAPIKEATSNFHNISPENRTKSNSENLSHWEAQFFGHQASMKRLQDEISPQIIRKH